MFDMIKKLQEAQKKMKEIKARLDSITVKGESSDGTVVVEATGNRKIVQIQVAEMVQSLPQDQLVERIKEATNHALEAAEKVNESEMKSAASGMMPGLGNMFS